MKSATYQQDKFLAEADMLSPDDMMLDSAPVTREQAIDAAKTVGEFALDMTPVVGDIKGAVELPDDLAMAKQMIEQGYDEGDIMSMGLGGALGALSVAGLVPMAGSLADAAQAPVKAAVKSRLAEQTDEMLQRKARIAERADMLSKDKGILTKDVGTQFRGRVVPKGQLHKAEFSGGTKEKPTPKIFHGSRSMNAPRSGEAAKYESTMYKFRTQYINDPVYDLFSDKESKLISKDTKSADDIVEEQGYGRFGIPVGERDGSIDIANVTFKKGKDGALDVHFIDIDKNIVEEEAVASIPANVDGDIVYEDMQSSLKELSNIISAKSGVVGETRLDAIRREGLPAFSDFKGEPGLSGPVATGEHAELKEPMMSFSRDSLVAMKPGFGGGNTENLIYADLPPELTRDMSPKEYLQAANLMAGEDRVIPELAEGQIGHRFPKSIHLEAEEAITNPELLNVKPLSDNRELESRVQRGQDTVNDIINMKDNIYKDIRTPENAADSMKMYNRTREILNKLQSLGSYTEQYGARGTYDDILETLLDQNDSADFQYAIEVLPNNLPEGQRKKIATSIRSIINILSTRSISGATFKGKEVLSDISDKDLNDALFSTKRMGVKKKKELDEAGLGIYMDGTLDLEKLGYIDLKRLLFLGTQKMNRGGLASRK